MATKLSVKQKLFLGLSLLMGLASLYWILMETGALSVLTDKQALREWVDGLGVWGPLAIIFMMITAIVMSPIPVAQLRWWLVRFTAQFGGRSMSLSVPKPVLCSLSALLVCSAMR